MPDAPMMPKCWKPRNEPMPSAAYAVAAAPAAVSVAGYVRSSAWAIATSSVCPERRSSRKRPSQMMPKLMPLPATMLNRNAVAMLRCPIASSVNPNVSAQPTAMVPPSAISARGVRKNSSSTPSTSAMPTPPTSTMSRTTRSYSAMPVTRSPE